MQIPISTDYNKLNHPIPIFHLVIHLVMSAAARFLQTFTSRILERYHRVRLFGPQCVQSLGAPSTKQKSLSPLDTATSILPRQPLRCAARADRIATQFLNCIVILTRPDLIETSKHTRAQSLRNPLSLWPT